MVTITLRQLKDLDACQEQVELFAAAFGTKVQVTVELAAQYADKFDFGWLAGRTLKASALAEYDKATASAWAEYDKVEASAWAKYGKATATAQAKYGKVRAPAQAEYGKARASAWAAAYINQEG